MPRDIKRAMSASWFFLARALNISSLAQVSSTADKPAAVGAADERRRQSEYRINRLSISQVLTFFHISSPDGCII